MMVLALDISTSSGWAIFEDGKPTYFGQIKCKVEGNERSEDYPYNYYKMAETMADELCQLAIKYYPEFIVVEETNKGKNRYHQKQLEYIHCMFVGRIKGLAKLESKCQLRYISTSRWRKVLNIGLDSEQRIFNKQIKVERDQHKQKLHLEFCKKYEWEMKLKIDQALGKRIKNQIAKEYSDIIESEVNAEMRKFRVKRESKVVGKINPKHLSINYVNEKFKMNFKTKDNDISDAFCIGTAFIEMGNI